MQTSHESPARIKVFWQPGCSSCLRTKEFLARHGIELTFEGFNEVAPEHWTAHDIVRWGLQVRDRVRAWWTAQERKDPDINFTAPTYYGIRPMHDVLERTAWHAAQHTRQIMLMLETYGTPPDGPLTAQDLEGLPVPDEVWDR